MSPKFSEPAEIAGIKLKNRIIRSATHEGMADSAGNPTDKLIKLYSKIAGGSKTEKNTASNSVNGGAGAIITGYIGIRQDGKSSLPGMTMLDDDTRIDSWKKVTRAVHDLNTPIIAQLAHCGRQTRSKITGLPTVAPSAIKDKYFSEDKPRELTEKEIYELIEDFAAAAARAKKAGFDGIQLHLAHGYLLSGFLSPHTNKRKDKWGGSVENRYRIIDHIFKKIKQQTKDFPILVKLNAHDGRKHGITVDDAVEFAKMLEKSGCAAIEVSGGTNEDGLFTIRGTTAPTKAAMSYTFKYKDLGPGVKKLILKIPESWINNPKPVTLFNLPQAERIKKETGIPVIAVGGIHSLEDINMIFSTTGIDFVSMSRPFIIEPDIANKFISGKSDRSKCIMCNYCGVILEEKPLKCWYGKMPEESPVA